VLLVAAVALAIVISAVLTRDSLRAAAYRADVPRVLLEEPLNGSENAATRASPDGKFGTSSATESDVNIAPFVPAQIFIPDAEVNTRVTAAPSSTRYNPFLGRDVLTFPVPDDAFSTVWWDEGPMPGEAELAIILGHARTPRTAVFNDVPRLEEAATVGLTGRTLDGQEVTARYQVDLVVTGISKTDADALRAVLDNPPHGATLALITCSGVVDEVLSSRVDNTVVFASLTGMFPGH